MKKRVLALLCCMLTVLSMTACTAKTPTGSITKEDNITSTSEDLSSVSTENSSEISSEISEEYGLENNDSNVNEVNFVDAIGNNSGIIYENKYFEIGCKLDSNWKMLSQDEINAANKVTTEMVDEEYAKIMNEAELVTDMYASNINELDTISANIERLDVTQTLIITEEYNINASAPVLKDMLESMGISNVSYEVKDITVAGKMHPAIFINGDINGIKCYEIVMCIKKDNFMYSLSVCSWIEDKTVDYINLFYEVK